MDATEIMKKLQEPFPEDDIEWRVGSTNKEKTQGMALAYVTNRAIQNRLDEVFGPFGWKNEFKEWKGQSQLCGISVKFDGEWITKWDGADNSNMEAVKGGLSDSMKRAAYQWGIGRYLYKLPSVWMPLKNQKYLDGTPKLPEWALPGSEDRVDSQTIGLIKAQWLKNGYKENALNPQIKKLYGKTLTQLSDTEAHEFLSKLIEKKGA